jgi:hypothetical protein
MLADYEVAWFEEPLLPDALADYIQPAKWRLFPLGRRFSPKAPSTLAAGWRIDIVQPDVTVSVFKEWNASPDGQREWCAIHSSRLNTAGLQPICTLAFADTDLVGT